MLKNNWHDFYKGRDERYYKYFIERYSPLIKYISKNITPGFTWIHEDACGMANLTRALYYEFGEREAVFSCSDISPEMLVLAASNIFSNKIEDVGISLHDAFKEHSDVFDAIVSHGFIEHFSNEDIVKIIENQLGCAHDVIHYVPGIKYGKPSFGDERLLEIEEWIDIYTPHNVEIFNDGYDYILHYR